MADDDNRFEMTGRGSVTISHGPMEYRAFVEDLDIVSNGLSMFTEDGEPHVHLMCDGVHVPMDDRESGEPDESIRGNATIVLSPEEASALGEHLIDAADSDPSVMFSEDDDE